MLIQARGCTWLPEQPETSVMEFNPEFTYLRTVLVRVVMGAFNHNLRKGTTLQSCHDWHKALKVDLPSGFIPQRSMVDKYIDLDGIQRCTGIPDELNNSQACTIEYARAVYDAHRTWLAQDVKSDTLSAEEFDCSAEYVQALILQCHFEGFEDIGIYVTKPFWA